MSGQNRDINIRVKVQDDGTVTLQTIGSQGKRSLEEIERQGQRTNDTLRTMDGLVGKVAGAFAGFEIGRYAGDAIMFAANVEQANVALGSIANSMGRTKAEAFGYRDALRDINITTNSATNATAQFIKQGMPLDALNKLGTAAQGAAISYQMMTGETISSSEALDKMVRSLVTGNVTELHTLGINVMLRDVLRENKIATGESSLAVDSHKRHLLMLNEVLENTAPLMNLYGDSTELASKKISSSKRPIEELKLALGDLFLPELTASATAFYQIVSDGQKRVRANADEMERWQGIISGVATELTNCANVDLGTLEKIASFSFDGWRQLLGLLGVQDVESVLDGIGVAFTSIGESLAALAASGSIFWDAMFATSEEETARYAAMIQAVWTKAGQNIHENLMRNRNAEREAAAERKRLAEEGAADEANVIEQQIVARNKGVLAQKEADQQAAAAAETGREEAKKAAEDHGKYLDTLIGKYLPLKKEMGEVSDAEKGLAELRAKGVISGAEYAQALDNLTASTTKGKDATRAADQADKARHETWQESQAMLEEMTATTMTEHEQAVARIEEKYVNLDDVIRQLVLSGQRSHEWATQMRNDLAIAQGIDLARADKDINSFVGKHEAGADQVKTVWDSAMDGLAAGEDEWVRHGEITVASMVDIFGSGIRRIVVDWMNGVATMNANSPQMRSIGGTAALMATMSGTGTGYAGLLSGGVGIVNELMNPGSYAASLGSLQSGLAGGLSSLGLGTVSSAATGAFGAGSYGAGSFMAGNFAPVGTGTVLAPAAGTGAAGTVGGMSSAAFGGVTAGLGTFLMGLAQGKNVGQAAASGVGAGTGAYIGTLILPGVGTILGSIAGSFLGDKLGASMFGGDDPWYRSTITGLTYQGEGFNYGEDGKYAPLMDSAEETIKGYVAQFPAQIQGEVLAAFSTAWASKDWNSGKEDSWRDVATDLATWMQTSIIQTMGQAVLQVVGKDLTQEAMAQLTAKAAAGQDISQYLNGLLAITTQLDQAVANNGRSAYQLELQAIDQQYEALGSQLRAYGIDLDRYTTLEKAHAIALEAANKKEEERLALIRKQTQVDDIPTLSADIMQDIGDLKGLLAAKDSAFQHAQSLNPTWGWDAKYANGGADAYPEIMDFVSAREAYEAKLYNVLDDVPQTLAEVNGMVNALTPPDSSAVAQIKKLGSVVTAAQDLASISTQDIYGNMVGWNATTDAQVGEIHSGAQQLSTLAGTALSTAINDLFAPVSDTIASHTGTGYQQGLIDIAKWQQERIDELVSVRDQMTETDYTSWLDDINEAAGYKTQDLIDQFITPVINAWQQFMDTLAIGDQSPYDISTRYRLGKGQIADLAEQAKGGDLEASAQLQAAAQEWLGISRQLNTSALAYGADVGWLQSLVDPILSALPTTAAQTAPAPGTDVATVLASIPAPQVTPLPAPSIAPDPLARGSRSSGDSEIRAELTRVSAELAGLKEALLAIANNTQAAASVLKRWDTNGPSNQDTIAWVL